MPNCSANPQAKHRAIRKDNLGELRSLRSPPALSSPADAQEFWGSSPCFRLIRGGIGPSRLAVASLLREPNFEHALTSIASRASHANHCHLSGTVPDNHGICQ